MPDYKNMSAKEALREAKDASGMTAEEIARGLGISASHMRRYLDAGDSYFPSLSTIPALCTVMRNTILLQWLEAQTAPEAPVPVSPAESRADVLTSVSLGGRSPRNGAGNAFRGEDHPSCECPRDPVCARRRDHGLPSGASTASTRSRRPRPCGMSCL